MSADRNEPWSRRRLAAALTAAACFGVLLVGSAGYAAWIGLSSEPTSRNRPADYPVGHDGVRGAAFRDAAAARPMLRTDADDLRPSEPSTHATRDLLVPAAVKPGRAGVPGGFPHSRGGAVGQLAAVTVTALNSLSVEQARAIYIGWSQDSRGAGHWEITRAIRDFHAGAGTVDDDGTALIDALPVGAQIKATDGRDWLIACVQLDVTVTMTEQTRFGYGHCDRMQWVGDRWVIAAGRPPAPAPSTWPRSDRSVEAGWENYVEEGVG